MSEIRILGADAGQQRAWLFSRLSEGRKAGRTAVVFVPEQYTLQTERDLLTGRGQPLPPENHGPGDRRFQRAG